MPAFFDGKIAGLEVQVLEHVRGKHALVLHVVPEQKHRDDEGRRDEAGPQAPSGSTPSRRRP